ncbi:MAG: DUF3256 family protein [Bacteroidota bacterium]|nr:DUF3256 family protein [Bacteroidota bacterium]
MHRQIILLIFSAISLFPVSGQISVEKLFQTMPTDLLWLDQSQRTELFAYFKDKKVDSIQNSLNGYCKLIDYNEETKHLLLKTSRKGSMEMQVLGAESSPFIAVIFTTCAPACQSHINFYSPEWKQFTMDFPTLSASDFIAKELSEYDLSIANRLLTPLFISYAFTEQGKSITASCNARQFLADDDWKELKPLLKSEQLSIKFEDGAWKIK